MKVTSEILNNKLIAKQGLDEKTVRLIEEKHSELDKIIYTLNSLEWNEENKERILQLNKSIELMEFTLQKLWGFSQNANYHTHWLRVKFCSCPKLDNLDPMYFGGGKILRGNCKIHGEEAQPEFWQNLKSVRDN